MSLPGKLDKPEPRWQAILALIAVGGIYTPLPIRGRFEQAKNWLQKAFAIGDAKEIKLN